ncbi:MAG TPA: serine protease [bacterium]|nr:serine protease [bacterium]
MGRGVSFVLLALVLVASAAAPGQAVPNESAERAVFQLEVLTRGAARSVGYGTAFFTGSDGTALTVSHVVYRASHDPEHYDLLAIVNKEFYSVRIVCASKLPYDPTKENLATGVPLGRDVAQVKLAPSQFPFRNWALRFKTGETLTLATAHRDPLPRFPYLTLGTGPSQGEHIRVVGFGHISPMPRVFVATGRIDRMTRARDGTEIFSAEFTSRPQPGNSGSPILNDRGQVVGIWPWSSLTQSSWGAGISSSALATPCP